MTVAVTGGARGIGRATAEAFAREGRAVAIGDLDLQEAERVAEAIGPSAIALPLDVRDRGSFGVFLDEAEERLGPLEVLVNNAGIMSIGAFADEDDETSRRMLEINAYGVLVGSRLAATRMAARTRPASPEGTGGGGHIVNVASTAGRVGFAGGATYCGTKFFVVGLSEALHAELRDSGVRVSCILPGLVDTELVAGLKVPRFVRATRPETVAEAIVQAVRTNRFETFVPRVMGGASRLTSLFPRRMVEAAGRAVGADRALFEHDRAARREYELRVKQEAE